MTAFCYTKFQEANVEVEQRQRNAATASRWKSAPQGQRGQRRCQCFPKENFLPSTKSNTASRWKLANGCGTPLRTFSAKAAAGPDRSWSPAKTFRHLSRFIFDIRRGEKQAFIEKIIATSLLRARCHRYRCFWGRVRVRGSTITRS